LTEFIHQSVRDLAWALSSPPLVSGLSLCCDWPDSLWYQQIYQQSEKWIKSVDADPAELDELINAQKDRRLGKYFETLWLYWLRNNHRYQLVENNVQVIIGGETLGELDFIVYDTVAKKTIHWELAIKFYLGVGDTREMGNWHGPHLRDRLDLKINHLLHRQSAITRRKRVVQWLQQQGIRVDGCAVILKGRLYFPWPLYQQKGGIAAIAPAPCTRELLHGWWFKGSEFDDVFDEDALFLPLLNRGWMEKIPTFCALKMQAKHAIFKTVSNGKVRLPLHVQVSSPRGIGDRAFLVADDWPLNFPDKITG